jgi:hypothetical protein
VGKEPRNFQATESPPKGRENGERKYPSLATTRKRKLPIPPRGEGTSGITKYRQKGNSEASVPPKGNGWNKYRPNGS